MGPQSQGLTRRASKRTPQAVPNFAVMKPVPPQARQSALTVRNRLFSAAAYCLARFTPCSRRTALAKSSGLPLRAAKAALRFSRHRACLCELVRAMFHPGGYVIILWGDQLRDCAAAAKQKGPQLSPAALTFVHGRSSVTIEAESVLSPPQPRQVAPEGWPTGANLTPVPPRSTKPSPLQNTIVADYSRLYFTKLELPCKYNVSTLNLPCKISGNYARLRRKDRPRAFSADTSPGSLEAERCSLTAQLRSAWSPGLCQSSRAPQRINLDAQSLASRYVQFNKKGRQLSPAHPRALFGTAVGAWGRHEGQGFDLRLKQLSLLQPRAPARHLSLSAMPRRAVERLWQEAQASLRSGGHAW
jgi:hypothetical protein